MKYAFLVNKDQTKTDTEKYEVSVVMPCLNEALTLKTCILKAQRSFKEHQLKGEIVIADNGSTDGSQKIAQDLGARVVDQPVKGYGAALRKGFDSARGKYIVMGDADDSYDFLDVHRFVAKLREGYDVVMGTRLKGEIKTGAMPWLHRYIGNPVLTFILNKLYKAGVSDTHCGMRGFRKDVLPLMDLRTQGMELASEMVIKAVRAGLKIAEIPVTLSPDGRNRKPYLRSFPDGWRHLRLMLMMAPDVLFVIPGIVLFVIGLMIHLAILLYGPLPLGHIRLAENTMVLAMMLSILGVQMFYLGLFSYLFIATGVSRTGDKQRDIILRYSRFEKGVILGATLFVVGLLGDVFVAGHWYSLGFGDLDRLSIRQSLFSSTLLILGLQIILFSFFLNMIGVDRAIYSGDLYNNPDENRNG